MCVWLHWFYYYYRWIWQWVFVVSKVFHTIWRVFSTTMFRRKLEDGERNFGVYTYVYKCLFLCLFRFLANNVANKLFLLHVAYIICLFDVAVVQNKVSFFAGLMTPWVTALVATPVWSPLHRCGWRLKKERPTEKGSNEYDLALFGCHIRKNGGVGCCRK